ncbi:trichohyalin-like isoform X1 [Penaeus monodon]|uniref:trichohyalin-like isoform X1 n=2 Tax=Penaeus monodon TaxID=6687 RepID=UPI0018A76E70|nr:trichohyalin-like isoform X1 [Penaeus monodon]
MNPSSTQATVGSAYFKAPPPREQSASQETLLEYLGIKPASSVGGDSYVEEPPYVVVPNKDFNGAYQTPYKDSKELEEVCEGDVPFVECRVEIQDGGEPGAKPPPEHNDYNYKVKEEPLDIFASSDNGYTSSTPFNPFSSDDSSSYTSSSNPIYSDAMKNETTLDLLCDSKTGDINQVGPRKYGRKRVYSEGEPDEIRIRRAKRAAAQRENRRRRREKMTDEEVRAYLAAQAAAQRERRNRLRAMMSEEELRRQKEITAALCRERRARIAAGLHPLYGSSEEELKRRRAAVAAAQRENRKKRREKMSTEELQRHLALEAAAQRERRKRRLEGMSEEERARYRAITAAKYRERRHARKMGMTEKERRAQCAMTAAQRRFARHRRQSRTFEDELDQHCSDSLNRMPYMEAKAPDEQPEGQEPAAGDRPQGGGRPDEELRPQRAAAVAAMKELQRLQESALEEERSALLDEQIAAQNLILQILMHAQRAATVECSETQEDGEEEDGPEQGGEEENTETGDGGGTKGLGKPAKKKKGKGGVKAFDKELPPYLEESGVELLAQLLELKQERPDEFDLPPPPPPPNGQSQYEGGEPVQSQGQESDDEEAKHHEEIVQQVQCLIEEEEGGEIKYNECEEDHQPPPEGQDETLYNPQQVQPGAIAQDQVEEMREHEQVETKPEVKYLNHEEELQTQHCMEIQGEATVGKVEHHDSPHYGMSEQKGSQEQGFIHVPQRHYPHYGYHMEGEHPRHINFGRSLVEQHRNDFSEKMYERHPYHGPHPGYYPGEEPHPQGFGTPLEEMQRFHHFQANPGNFHLYRGKNFYS